MDIATTTAEALARYEAAFNEERLIQQQWHTELDGRQLACALGVLGDVVDGPAQCPAAIMPRWLAQMVPGFFDRQKFDDAKDWGLRFYKALDRIGGNVPFSVIHDWHANTVCQLGIEASEIRKRDTAPHKALQALHQRALAGEKTGADEWRPVLKSADADANANAYAYADAYAYAYAYADADANANANAYAYADAYAYAYAYAWKRLADGMVSALDRVEA
ncbi:hypothetical protein [Rhizorhapis suberifaciens]|uniref:Uncharacterized protein n=1 Tax=Rhizorhapis suberifaciens TaxID=13656 RepID=A0A840HXQ6_9SPHN|nr:hypothetical protein [Rhizorhapis suberifaciens]MBB4642339.1 hypothetical protein [Rhizorhapis suberifaciens]